MSRAASYTVTLLSMCEPCARPRALTRRPRAARWGRVAARRAVQGRGVAGHGRDLWAEDRDELRRLFQARKREARRHLAPRRQA